MLLWLENKLFVFVFVSFFYGCLDGLAPCWRLAIQDIAKERRQASAKIRANAKKTKNIQ